MKARIQLLSLAIACALFAGVGAGVLRAPELPELAMQPPWLPNPAVAQDGGAAEGAAEPGAGVDAAEGAAEPGAGVDAAEGAAVPGAGVDAAEELPEADAGVEEELPERVVELPAPVAREGAAGDEADEEAAAAEAAAPEAEQPLEGAPALATEQPLEADEALAADEEAAERPLTPEERAALEAEERARAIEELQGSMQTLNQNQLLLEQRADELEENVAQIEERGAFLEADRAARLQALANARAFLVEIEQALASGDAGVDPSLAELAALLGGVARQSFQYSGEAEAELALAAQQAVQEARASLVRADLYSARGALAVALQHIELAIERAQNAAQPLFREE